MSSSDHWPAAHRDRYQTEPRTDFAHRAAVAQEQTDDTARAASDTEPAPDKGDAVTTTPATPPATPAPTPAETPETVTTPATTTATTPAAATSPTAASLLPRHTTLRELPATWGWRGRVHRLTKGAVAPKPTEAEVRHRQATVAVRRAYARPMTVMFANPKGGAGKTPATLLAGATFGQARGGYVVAWDNNETRGTLGVRGLMPDQDLTVWDLLGHLDRFERIDARAGDLSGYVRAQGEARFDVLASDESPENMSEIGADEFERLRAVLSRFYKLVLVDTGNNIRATNWQAAADAADLLVVCSSYRRDVAFSAAWMLDHLERTGRGDLARRAVTVLSASHPQVPQEARAEIIEHFSARTRAVVEIPYDPSIAPGERIDVATVAQGTRDAWLYACAAIADGLAEADQTRR
ncbi:MAG TPA: cobalamin biosynthesis protein CobQ [Actinoplanes sp.]|nr:cobalamin biosynthesis protein CobQ [Actinoplanes sp.]